MIIHIYIYIYIYTCIGLAQGVVSEEGCPMRNTRMPERPKHPECPKCHTVARPARAVNTAPQARTPVDNILS